ncbi:MAG: hypothetical protein WKF93_03215 [Acidimicrobiales bacterium]
MTRRADRVVIAVLGLVLAGLGTVLVLAAGDVLDLDEPATLLDRAARSIDQRPALWLGLLALAAGLLVAIGARVLRRSLLRPSRPAAIELSDGPRGRTRLEPAAIERAVRADLRHVDGIRASRVTLRTTGPRPRLRVVLTLDPALADVAAARAATEAAYRRLATCLALEGVRADLVVRVGKRSTVSRVH